MNVHVHGQSFERKLRKRRKDSLAMLRQALKVLETALEQYGRVAVEWPKNSGWWAQPEWLMFEQKHQLHRVDFDGCGFGAQGKHRPSRNRGQSLPTTSGSCSSSRSANATEPTNTKRRRVQEPNRQKPTRQGWCRPLLKLSIRSVSIATCLVWLRRTSQSANGKQIPASERSAHRNA